MAKVADVPETPEGSPEIEEPSKKKKDGTEPPASEHEGSGEGGEEGDEEEEEEEYEIEKIINARKGHFENVRLSSNLMSDVRLCFLSDRPDTGRYGATTRRISKTSCQQLKFDLRYSHLVQYWHASGGIWLSCQMERIWRRAQLMGAGK